MNWQPRKFVTFRGMQVQYLPSDRYNNIFYKIVTIRRTFEFSSVFRWQFSKIAVIVAFRNGRSVVSSLHVRLGIAKYWLMNFIKVISSYCHSLMIVYAQTVFIIKHRAPQDALCDISFDTSRFYEISVLEWFHCWKLVSVGVISVSE